jgi:hypothetical protein
MVATGRKREGTGSPLSFLFPIAQGTRCIKSFRFETGNSVMTLCRLSCGFAVSTDGTKRQFCGNKGRYSFGLIGFGGKIFPKKSKIKIVDPAPLPLQSEKK